MSAPRQMTVADLRRMLDGVRGDCRVVFRSVGSEVRYVPCFYAEACNLPLDSATLVPALVIWPLEDP